MGYFAAGLLIGLAYLLIRALIVQPVIDQRAAERWIDRNTRTTERADGVTIREFFPLDRDVVQ